MGPQLSREFSFPDGTCVGGPPSPPVSLLSWTTVANIFYSALSVALSHHLAKDQSLQPKVVSFVKRGQGFCKPGRGFLKATGNMWGHKKMLVL